jgi:hypothetical protein
VWASLRRRRRNPPTTLDDCVDLLLKEAGWALGQPRDRELDDLKQDGAILIVSPRVFLDRLVA